MEEASPELMEANAPVDAQADAPPEAQAVAPAPTPEEVVARGLHTLGKTPYELRLAYLGVYVNGAGLDSLDVLQKYQHLQEVDVSVNSLSTLAPLAALPYLTRLDASHNSLTSALDFRPPKCDAEKAWNEGDRHVGSALVQAVLSHNAIEDVSSVSHHACLRVLDLSHNCLTAVEGLRGLRLLTHLDLSANRIAELGDSLAQLSSVVVLNLAGNEIASLEGLERLTRLEVLDVAHNQITSLAGVEGLVGLKRLDVSANRIAELREIRRLASLPLLLHLGFCGNAAADAEHYRAKVIVHLQCLSTLDGEGVCAEEKVKALNLHAAPGGELENRKLEWSKHFPGQALQDLLPPLPPAS